METFIEYVIIDNLLIDYLLLKESAVILKVKAKKSTLFLSASIGAAFAVFFPLLNISPIISFILKIACAFLMCFIAVKHRSFRGLVFFFNVFLLSSFVLGGVITGFLYLLGINEIIQAYYQAKAIPVGLAVVGVYLLFIAVKRFAEKVAGGALAVCSLIDCEIVIRGEKFSIKAFFDSGNLLSDKKSGLPIAVMGRTAFKRIINKVSPPCYGEIAAVGASGRFTMKTFRVDYVRITHKGRSLVKDALIAVGDDPAAIGAEMLIGRSLLGGLYDKNN